MHTLRFLPDVRLADALEFFDDAGDSFDDWARLGDYGIIGFP